MRKIGKKAAIRKIMVPTDFSPSSDRALDYAISLAQCFGATVLLLHVIEPFPYSVTDSLTVVDHFKALHTIASSLIKEARKKLTLKNIPSETRLVSGSPYREIVKEVERNKADLIVMGTHGRTGVGRLLIGSQAEKVVRLAGCPVATVRLLPSEEGKDKKKPKRPARKR
ncbi:MAG TPA: universal stress protein [Nitrospiria bacterium]|nr:universal stress protein [Nitrospiria bacterium]